MLNVAVNVNIYRGWGRCFSEFLLSTSYTVIFIKNRYLIQTFMCWLHGFNLGLSRPMYSDCWGGGPDVVVKAARLSRRCSLTLVFRFRCFPPHWCSGFKKQKCSFPAVLWGASVLSLGAPGREFWILCLEECYLIQLTILRIFSWPSSTCISTKVT